VVGAGGACAIARPGAAINTHESRSDWLIRMGRERPADAVGSPWLGARSPASAWMSLTPLQAGFGLSICSETL
jgi:hypothetical protein